MFATVVETAPVVVATTAAPFGVDPWPGFAVIVTTAPTALAEKPDASERLLIAAATANAVAAFEPDHGIGAAISGVPPTVICEI